MFHAPFFRKIILSAHSLHRCNDSSIPRSFPRIVLPRIFTSSKPKLLTTSPKSSSPKPPRTLGFMLFFQGVNIHNTTTIVGGFNQPIWKTYDTSTTLDHETQKRDPGNAKIHPSQELETDIDQRLKGSCSYVYPRWKFQVNTSPPKKKRCLGSSHTEPTPRWQWMSRDSSGNPLSSYIGAVPSFSSCCKHPFLRDEWHIPPANLGWFLIKIGVNLGILSWNPITYKYHKS